MILSPSNRSDRATIRETAISTNPDALALIIDCLDALDMKDDEIERGEWKRKRRIVPPNSKHGRLRFIREMPRGGDGKRLSECECECGAVCVVRLDCLISGKTRSCGCFLSESSGARVRTHGLSSSREYKIWTSIKQRCLNADDKHYPEYGGRGITICAEWAADFICFSSYIGPRPTPDHSVDRIDNNGSYEPGNVRWATTREQNRNKRTNITINYKGKMVLLRDVCTEIGFNYRTAHRRLRAGRPVLSLFDKDVLNDA